MHIIYLLLAVLVWLNYKNAYEYWNEQRLALNNEVQTATQQVMDRLPLTALSQPSAPALSTLFLQLTVDDLGICLPLGYTNVSVIYKHMWAEILKLCHISITVNQ